MVKELCIYHKNCPDGFGSAYIFWEFFKQYEEDYDLLFHAADYKEEPPWDLIDQVSKVYLADFSYSLDICKKILERGAHITILDHHKTAFEEFECLPQVDRINGDIVRELVHNGKTLTVRIDQTKSGVGNVWEYFYPVKTMPTPLKYIQDRDLWKWEFHDSKPFLKGWDLLPFDFQMWKDEMYDDKFIKQRIDIGYSIARYDEKHMDSLMKKVSINTNSYGTYALVNCPYWLCSDLGNRFMLELDIDYAVLFQYDCINHGYNFSFRSLNEKADVSAIAKKFGGGGHHNASGCYILKGDFNPFIGGIIRE